MSDLYELYMRATMVLLELYIQSCERLHLAGAKQLVLLRKERALVSWGK
jgi:hypothetical protein